LKARMKEARVATYLTDMAIRKPREDRIKMRLILGTHSSFVSVRADCYVFQCHGSRSSTLVIL